MFYILMLMWICNIIDIFATLDLFNHGYAELNPFMNFLLNSPLWFIFIKFFTMTLLCLYLWKNKENKYAKYCSIFGSSIFILIAIYYLLFYLVLLV